MGKTRAMRLFRRSPVPRRQQRRLPRARASFGGVEGAEEGPKGESHGEGEHHVGNEDAGEKKNSDAGGHDQAGVEAGAFAEGPDPKAAVRQGEADGGEGDGKASDNVGDVKIL